MGVPKKRTSKMRRDRRRANWKVTRVPVSTCPNCREPIEPHCACKACGQYHGRQVVETA
ncbi:MAG: 50S ribosomal protein L32 [Deltaproteobacteria bacterium]